MTARTATDQPTMLRMLPVGIRHGFMNWLKANRDRRSRLYV
jgi:hypothetical protein